MDKRKAITYIIIAVSIIIVVSLIFYKYKYMTTNENKGPVVNNENDTTKVSLVREYQINDVIKKVYKLWYQVDRYTYKENTEEALVYFGDCGTKLIKEYNDDKVYDNLISKNLSLTVKIKDIKIDTHKKNGTIEGIQFIRHLNGVVRRNMFASFSYYYIEPTRANPFGIKIEKWKVFNNKLLKQ